LISQTVSKSSLRFSTSSILQCPGIVLSDLLLSEGRLSVDPKDLEFAPAIDRGELITSPDPSYDGGYKRYKITDSGISPRAIPGVAGFTYTAASDEHDEDGVLISDEFTNPTKRRAMMEKRMRKVAGIAAAVPAPELWGPREADVTLIGWGSTRGVIEEASEILTEHKGFSFLDVFSPCVTYNHDNTYQWFRPRVKKLEDDASYDSADWVAAMEKSLLWDDQIPIGKFFERTDLPALHAAEPVLNNGALLHSEGRLPPDVARSFIKELM
jgi:hypothetical protein